MTKKSNVHFPKERHLSTSQSDIMNGDARNPSRSSGIKCPTRTNGNGVNHRFDKSDRPGYDRADTTASGWATENEEENAQLKNVSIPMETV